MDGYCVGSAVENRYVEVGEMNDVTFFFVKFAAKYDLF